MSTSIRRASWEALLPLSLSCQWRVGVRVHAPDERDRDLRIGGPFGMTTREAVESLRRLRDAGADVQSVHFHRQGPPQPDAYVRAVGLVSRICEAASFRPRFVDLGGGLPPPASATLPSSVCGAPSLWRGRASCRSLEQVWLENGRFVTDQSAALAVRVLDVKDRAEGRYLICDGGRTNHACC